jgi:hypothetical protein
MMFMGQNNSHKPKLRLLIVSVGSLVGQNILDSLEFPEFSRRHLVDVFGTNSIAMCANNFRCNGVYLVPPTASPDYAERMRQVLLEVQPDLVLSARDEDTAAMWRLMDKDRSLPGKLPYGSLESVLYALDKWQSFLFCKKYDLPFAESYIGRAEELHSFVNKVGYPMIAKPVEGYASKGVFFVRDWEEAVFFLRRDGYILQEYLGAPESLEEYFQFLDGPRPLFSEVPDISHHTCHIPIDPEGEIGEIFVLRNHHNFGAVTRLQRVAHPELENLARSFGEALIAEGGFGPLSVQFRLDRNGGQKAQEMNLRTTGSTFARLMMGQDELGQIISNLMPHKEFPLYSRQPPAHELIVTKSLATYSMEEGQVEALSQVGQWQR